MSAQIFFARPIGGTIFLTSICESLRNARPLTRFSDEKKKYNTSMYIYKFVLLYLQKLCKRLPEFLFRSESEITLLRTTSRTRMHPSRPPVSKLSFFAKLGGQLLASLAMWSRLKFHVFLTCLLARAHVRIYRASGN